MTGAGDESGGDRVQKLGRFTKLLKAKVSWEMVCRQV
jgi:hypothetical protein